MFAEALTVDTFAPSEEQDPFLPIEVLVVALRDKVVLYPSNLRIRWGYQGRIRWHLISDDPLFTFASVPLTFDDADAPFGTPKQVGTDPIADEFEVTVTNTNVNSVQVPFGYTLNFMKSGTTTRYDPTVENDPPTP